MDTVLADFGLACVLPEGGFAEGRFGTPDYFAPEIWQNVLYTEKVDIWSLGVTLYSIFKGTFLCSKGIETNPAGVILNALASMEADPTIPLVFKDLLIQMLQIDPALRISAEDALTHEWFQPSEDADKPEAPGIAVPEVFSPLGI